VTNAVVVAEQRPIAIVKQALEDRTAELLSILPESMGGTPEKRADRFKNVALMAVSKSPELLECTPASIVRSIIESAEIGLEPTGALNRAWLVGFRKNQNSPKEAQLMIGYQGYADLMRDSGKITRITTELVYEGDLFRVIKGSREPEIVHEPAYGTEDPTKITHAYAVAWFADGGSQFEVMTRAQIELIRAKSRQRNGPAWTEGYPQMCRKTVLRRLSNYTPLSARAQQAIARDDEREFSQGEGAPSGSRTAAVKAQVAARLGLAAGETAQNDPGADEKPEVAPESAPEASAAGQTETDGQAREICGAASDANLGPVLYCVLDPGNHRAHTADDGTKFSAVKS
jgi:recombination protein RecT